MKKAILGLIFCSLLLSTTAQEMQATSGTTASPVQKPAIPGGQKALQKLLQTQLRYPPLAIEHCIEGEVKLRLYLLENGAVGSAEVLEGIGFGCDEEALRLAMLLPPLGPAAPAENPVGPGPALVLRFRLR